MPTVRNRDTLLFPLIHSMWLRCSEECGRTSSEGRLLARHTPLIADLVRGLVLVLFHALSRDSLPHELCPAFVRTDSRSGCNQPKQARTADANKQRERLTFHWLGLVHEKSIQIDAVREDEVSDVATSDAEPIQMNGVASLDGHLHNLEVSVHADVHT